jgi:hypothetical protein
MSCELEGGMRGKHRLAAVTHRPNHAMGEALRLPWDRGPDVVADADAWGPAALAESPQRIFKVLDGVQVCAAGRAWRVEVFGVLADDTAIWVQLRLSGWSEHMVTLKLRADDSADQAVAVIAHWLSHAARVPQILTST